MINWLKFNHTFSTNRLKGSDQWYTVVCFVIMRKCLWEPKSARVYTQMFTHKKKYYQWKNTNQHTVPSLLWNQTPFHSSAWTLHSSATVVISQPQFQFIGLPYACPHKNWITLAPSVQSVDDCKSLAVFFIISRFTVFSLLYHSILTQPQMCHHSFQNFTLYLLTIIYFHSFFLLHYISICNFYIARITHTPYSLDKTGRHSIDNNVKKLTY